MKQSSIICLSALLMLPIASASSTQVYTWVDDDGVTHFSESPPNSEAVDTKLIDVLPATVPDNTGSGDDNFYSVVKQAERMETRRLENEKLAAEKKKADAEASKARAQASAIEQGAYNNAPGNGYSTLYLPAYPLYGNRPWKPGYGHRPDPEHPIHPGHPVQPIHPVHPVRPGTPRASLGKTPGMPR